MTSVANDLALALELADRADAITMERFGALDLRVDTKPDLTPVTDADRSAETLLRDVARRRTGPTTRSFGEEFGGTAAFLGRQWVHRPDRRHQELRPRGAGVVHTDRAPRRRRSDGRRGERPALGRRWWAGQGRARSRRSWATTRRISVSGVADLGVGQPVVLGSDHRLGRRRDRGSSTLTDAVWRVRAYGDFWSYCLVAEGAVDIAAEPEVKLWDIAPLDILVREAGGTFTQHRRPARSARRQRAGHQRTPARRRC